mmetsp:Transcript_51047/g.169095  ORF Transcript_51047/g.169095 Transcript_51047/m.169095 type:complete len:253 (-) Transcript_51047:1663-2421(-)
MRREAARYQCLSDNPWARFWRELFPAGIAAAPPLLAGVGARSHYCVDAQKAAAFWKRRSHGADAFASHSGGAHGHCHLTKQRSGCGIMARWRPSGEQRAAMPSGEPLGLCGYSCVTSHASLMYRSGAWLPLSTACSEASRGKCARPSPWATHTPRLEPSIPRRRTAGEGATLTALQRDSNRPDELCTKRGCSASGMGSPPGTQPSSAISWQPLHTPSEKASGRLRKASNCAESRSSNLIVAAQPLAESSTSA